LIHLTTINTDSHERIKKKGLFVILPCTSYALTKSSL